MALETVFVHLRLVQNIVPCCYVCEMCAEYNLFLH